MRCLIGLAIAGLACGLSGCTSVEGRGFRPEPELVAVTLWVPPNYLSGTPWPLDLLSGRDAEALLRREFTFRANDSYSLAHLCKEVTRVTGKRIVCLPPAAVIHGVRGAQVAHDSTSAARLGRCLRFTTRAALQASLTRGSKPIGWCFHPDLPVPGRR